MGFFDNRVLSEHQKRVDEWGIVEATEADESDGKLIVHRMQDVEPIIESNKAMADEVERFQRRERLLGRHAARVPNLVIEQWCQQHGVSYALFMSREGDELWRRMLNDSDNSKFRIWPGRI